MIILLLTACATFGDHSKKQVQPKVESSQAAAKSEDRYKTAIEAIKLGINARQRGKDKEAKETFQLACRYFRNMDTQGSMIMKDITQEMRKIASISAFKYAPDDSFELLIIYLEMQNLFIERDSTGLKKMEVEFYVQSKKVQRITAQVKQQRLKELGEQVATGIQTIQKEQGGIFEIYPTIYVVKSGDTLPGIAARHEIYNDSYMWPLIYKANRDQIKDPKVIYAGQDLKIPRDMAIDEIIEARTEAGAPEPKKIPKGAYVPKRGG